MTKLQAAVTDFSDALKQRDRLQLSRWLRDLAQTARATCRLCGGDFDHANGELDALCDALANVEASARQGEPVPATFDKELVQVRAQVRRVTDNLNGIRARQRVIEERSKRIKDERLSRSSATGRAPTSARGAAISVAPGAWTRERGLRRRGRRARRAGDRWRRPRSTMSPGQALHIMSASPVRR